MKILKLYEGLILENQIASCTKAFGQELFAQQLGGSEPNTEVETDYAQLIYKFTVSDFGKNINPKAITALENLKSCTAQYPEVLIPENEIVHRGVMVPLSYYIQNKLPIPTESKGQPFNYKSKSPVQSWTTNKYTAMTFSSADMLYDIMERCKEQPDFLQRIPIDYPTLQIPLIMSLKTSKEEFMFKAEHFNKLSHHNYEDEVLRISHKSVVVDAYFNPYCDVSDEYAVFDKFLDELSALIM